MWANEGSSSSTRSVGSPSSRFSVSAGDRTRESPQRGLKDFAKRFVDSEIFSNKLQDWLYDKLDKSPDGKLLFESPFKLDELREFDYALEGIGFQQLIRMPCGPYASMTGSVEADAYFAIEDFLHAGAQSLWEAFWGNDGPMPFFISCPYGAGSKFHTVEKAVARGKVEDLCGTALLVKNSRNSQGYWDQVVELALLRTDLGVIPQENNRIPSFAAVGEALFYSFYMLISRSLSKSNILKHVDCAYVMLVDCQYGGVVKLKGDVNKLDINANKVYDSAVEWIQQHAEVSISSFEEIWNKLGNANWGDVGTRQLLLATFYSIVQCKGSPKKSKEQEEDARTLNLPAKRLEPGTCDELEITKKVYMDVAIDGEAAGRIVIGLFGNDAPIGATRFAELASGKRGVGYRKKEFVKITPFYIQNAGIRSYGVDSEMAKRSLLADELVEESVGLEKRCKGSKSFEGAVSLIVRDPSKPPSQIKLVAKGGKIEVQEEEVKQDPNGTEFVIATKSVSQLEVTNLLVGKVVDGMDVVAKIASIKTVQENSGSPYFQVAKLIGDKRAIVAERGFNRPYSKIVITKCGELI